MGNPACNMIVGCNLDVVASTPQSSVVVMTDADWAGDVKDRRSFSGIAVENMWYSVYASFKKQNMVCLSSGESELMALVGGDLRGVSQRETNGANCADAHLGRLCCVRTAQQLWDFVKRKGASRRTRHVDTKVYFVQAWATEPGQRILKIHGDSQQVADCLTKNTTPRAAHRKALGL